MSLTKAMPSDSAAMLEPKPGRFPTTRHTELLGPVLQGCDKAWRDFFHIYGPIIYGFARHARLSDFEADEVLAAVMREFMRGKYDRNKGRLRHYLRKITNNAIKAQFRQRKERGVSIDSAGALESASPAADSLWEDLELLERLRLCLARLRSSGVVKVRDLYIFERVALRGESPDAVAKEYKLKAGSIYRIRCEVTQELRRIREELDGQLGEV